MTFEEYAKDKGYYSTEDYESELFKVAQEAWEAGVQEGIRQMYFEYDICPECFSAYGKHKMDCGRGQ